MVSDLSAHSLACQLSFKGECRKHRLAIRLCLILPRDFIQTFFALIGTNLSNIQRYKLDGIPLQSTRRLISMLTKVRDTLSYATSLSLHTECLIVTPCRGLC